MNSETGLETSSGGSSKSMLSTSKSSSSSINGALALPFEDDILGDVMGVEEKVCGYV